MSAFTVTVLSKGKPVNPRFGLMSVQISQEVNRIPYAELVYADGEVTTGQFVISDSDEFMIGNAIEIKIRYESESSSEKTIFTGLVVRQEINVEQSLSTLKVVLKDSALVMTKGKNHRVFNQINDTEIIKKILGFNTVTAGNIAETTYQHIEMIQYGCSDWDFIVTRAECNGLLVLVKDGTVSVLEIVSPNQPKLTVEYGIDDIYSFDIAADGERQYAEFIGTSWDPQKQEKFEVKKEGNPLTIQGNLSKDSLAKKIGHKDYNFATTANLANPDIKNWATGKLKRTQLSLIRGYIAVPGLSNLELLDTLEIKGMGLRFNGYTLITGIGHRITAGNWITDIQFGLSDEWLLHSNEVNDIPASGLLPAVSGLQLGTVTKIFEEKSGDLDIDTYKNLKIQVALPALMQETPYLVWARLACPDAGKGRGYYFRPEVADEVVVGFVNDDPRQAIILGSLFSPVKNITPKRFGVPDTQNNASGIASKSGIVFGFDDENSIVYIETPGNNSFKLDDNGKTIELKDQHGNSIVMNEEGITLKSAKNLKLTASNNVEIDGLEVDFK